MPDQYNIMDKTQAKTSIKSLMFEASKLDPSALMNFFEIDLSSVVKSINSSLVQDANEVDIDFTAESGEENIREERSIEQKGKEEDPIKDKKGK